MRTVVRYEGDGRHRRPVWSKNEPSDPGLRRRPGGELVVGRSERELHREAVRRAKAHRDAAA